MGLAASQARLLSITARMHDVEFESQDIMQKKVALATQKDDLYLEYMEALDEKKLKIAYDYGDGKLNYVDATFASVCAYDPDRKSGTYALTDPNSGDMIVDDDVYKAYKNNFHGDKYAFALKMMGVSESEVPSELYAIGDAPEYKGWTKEDVDVENNKVMGLEYSTFFLNNETGLYDGVVLMEANEAAVYNEHADEPSNSDLKKLLTQFEEAIGTGDKNKISEAVDAFRTALYNKYSGEILNKIINDDSSSIKSDDFDVDEFNYYVHLYEGIEAAGGCRQISEYSDGTDTDNDWFSNVVLSGQLQLNEYKTGANSGWKAISAGTSTKVEEVTDEAKVKKAEATYQYELGKVNSKDKRYDQDLKKLETERTALNTELESIKKVEQENIERTFGIFS